MRVLAVFCALVACAGCKATKPALSTAVIPEATSLRIIKPGCILSITVKEDRSLCRAILVPDYGTIYYPPLGQIAAVGRTEEQVALDIKQGLERDYFQTANVSVMIQSRGATLGEVVIDGAVRHPGPVMWLPELTLELLLRGAEPLVPHDKLQIQLARIGSDGKIYRTVISYDPGRARRIYPSPGDHFTVLGSDRIINF